MGDDKNKQNKPDLGKKTDLGYNKGGFIGESKKDHDSIKRGAEIVPRPRKGDDDKKE